MEEKTTLPAFTGLEIDNVTITTLSAEGSSVSTFRPSAWGPRALLVFFGVVPLLIPLNVAVWKVVLAL